MARPHAPGGPWNDAECALLRLAVAAGESWDSMAPMIGRSAMACQRQASRLMITPGGRRAKPAGAAPLKVGALPPVYVR